MKYIYYILSLFLVIVISSCTGSRYYQGNPDEYSDEYSYNNNQRERITYQQFYNDLSPYGNWLNYGNYGYVWIPNQPGFRPYYTNGHWIYTEFGWTWVSNYRWGWAPFHYGRWLNDIRYGWVWIPGYEWAPAWVSWRGGGDYYGWAPLGPGMNIHIQMGAIPYNNWTFIPRKYITHRRINNYYVNPSRNVTIIHNTTIINNTTIVNNNGNITRNRHPYNQGPSITDVQRNTGVRIRRFNLVTSDNPGATQVNSNSVRIFRPVVNQQQSTNDRPQRVVTPDNTRGNSSAPVREFPKDQTPEIIRNEPSVNRNSPSVTPTPERNNTPARVFPKKNENPPETNRPEELKQNNRNPSPANSPTRNATPQRTLPNNEQENRSSNNQAPQRQNRNSEKRETSTQKKSTVPSRTFSHNQQNEIKNTSSQQPVRRITPERNTNRSNSEDTNRQTEPRRPVRR